HVLSLDHPLFTFINGKRSLGALASGYLVLVLVGAAAIAIALFASAISPNQLVAGVTGSAFTVTLLVLWMVADKVSYPFNELFSYLAIHNQHFTPFSKGLVHTADGIYYISAVVFFSECSVSVVQPRRWKG